MRVNAKVMTGENKDKIHTLFISKKNKSGFSNFMRAFWTDDEIFSRNGQHVVPTKLIGRAFTAKPSVPKEIKGKMYQNLGNYIDLGVTEEVSEDDKTGSLPF